VVEKVLTSRAPRAGPKRTSSSRGIEKEKGGTLKKRRKDEIENLPRQGQKKGPNFANFSGKKKIRKKPVGIMRKGRREKKKESRSSS